MVDKIIAVLKECDVTGSETWWWKVEEKIEALLSASDNSASHAIALVHEYRESRSSERDVWIALGELIEWLQEQQQA